MSQSSTEEKTEEPTARRLQDARKRAQVAKSADLASGLSLSATLLVVMALTPWYAHQIAELQLAVERLMERPTTYGVRNLLIETLGSLLSWSLPPVLTAAGVGTAALWLQVGPVLSLDPIKPKLERLNPAEGLKKLVSIKTVVTFAQLSIKTAIVALAIWLVCRQLLPDAIRVIDGDISSALAVARAAMLQLLMWTGGAFVLLGAADFAYQRWQSLKDMRMSRSEVKRENKEDEGDGHLKSERKRIAAEPPTQELLKYMPHASLILEHEDGRIVVLIYRPRMNPVPLFLLRGSGELAERAKAAVASRRVRVAVDSTLTATLYSYAHSGESVPEFARADVLRHLAIAAR